MDLKQAAEKRAKSQKAQSGRTEIAPGITVTPPMVLPEGHFPPMDMSGPPPPPKSFRMGPPNPNSDLVPEGAMPGWVHTASAQRPPMGQMPMSPQDEELMYMIRMGMV